MGGLRHVAYDYKFERWIKVLKDNWIATVGTLMRVPLATLAGMNLPLALRLELERVAKMDPPPSALTTFFHLNLPEVGQKASGLKVSQIQKDLIHASFRALIRHKEPDSGVSGIRRFETEFYPHFFAANPAAKRLFDVNELELQSKAFVKMLYWIMENMDNKDLASVLEKLGGRHIIYEVADGEYELFSVALTNTFVTILGTKVFNDETVAAWKEVIGQMAAAMKEAGKLCRKGHQGVLLRERGNGAWVPCYVNLMLDVLHVYKDKGMKDTAGSYPLQGVEALEFPKGKTSTNVFQISSLDPPFCLAFATETKDDLKFWIAEFDWRIQAIQRVVAVVNDGESSERSHADISRDEYISKVAKKQRKQKRKAQAKRRVDSDGEEELTPEAKQEAFKTALERGIELSDTEKDVLRKSWESILDKKYSSGKTGIGKLFQEFYKLFFEENPAGRRLFETQGIESQGRALVSMIGMIVKSIDDFTAFSSVIAQLGGRHEIYGVSGSDYVCFASCLSKTIANLADGDASAVESVWNKCMLQLGKIMELAQAAVASEVWKTVANTSLRGNGSFKNAAIVFRLTHLDIYSNEKQVKLRSSVPLATVAELNILAEPVGMPTEHVVALTTNTDQTMNFSFPTNEAIQTFFEELNWRVAAVTRSMKYDADGSSHESADESATKRKARRNKSTKKAVFKKR